MTNKTKQSKQNILVMQNTKDTLREYEMENEVVFS